MKEFVEKLIERLEEEILTCQSAYTESIIGMCGKSAENYMSEIHAYKKTKKIVNQLAEEYKGGWIPCSERLPSEKDGVVLICDEKGRVNTGKHSEHNMTWYIGDMYAVGGAKVIAWMPLPEPYQPKGE